MACKQINRWQALNLEIEYPRRSLVQLLLMLPGQNAGDGEMANSGAIIPTSSLYCKVHQFSYGFIFNAVLINVSKRDVKVMQTKHVSGPENASQSKHQSQ